VVCGKSGLLGLDCERKLGWFVKNDGSGGTAGGLVPGLVGTKLLNPVLVGIKGFNRGWFDAVGARGPLGCVCCRL